MDCPIHRDASMVMYLARALYAVLQSEAPSERRHRRLSTKRTQINFTFMVPLDHKCE